MDFDAIACELVRAIRGDMSQASLNRRLGSRSNQVRRWEKGERRVSWKDFSRICSACEIDLPLAMRSMLPAGANVLDTEVIVSRIIGAASISDVARRTNISRFTLMRWMKDDGSPTLADLLNLIQHCQFTLFEFLRNLVNVSDLPSARAEFEERQARKQIYYRRPEVAGILCCLKLDEYRQSERHIHGFIARKIGISQASEEEALADLTEVGKIHWNGTHYVPKDEQLELTDSQEFNAFCHYWFGRAQTYLQELPNPHPVINFGMDINASSAATLEKIRDEYKQFYRRIRALLVEDKGPKDRVYVFNALFFDLEKRHQETSATKLWIPVSQPTNKREVEANSPPE